MRSVLTKFALAAVLLLLMMSCRPTENSENKQANSPAQPAATAATTPAVISGSGKSGANETAGPAQGNPVEVTAEVKSELSTATRELLGIMLRGETNEAAGRLTDDFKNTRPDGTVEDKTQYLAHLKRFPDFSGFIFDKFKVESLQGDTAVVTGLVQVGGKDKDSYIGSFRETFVKRQGKWLLQSAQNTEPKLSN